MKTTPRGRTWTAVAGLSLLVAGVAGCGGPADEPPASGADPFAAARSWAQTAFPSATSVTATPSASEPARATLSPAVSATPTQQAPATVALSGTGDWFWSGGLLLTEDQLFWGAANTVALDVWAPGMPASRACLLNPLETGEEGLTNISVIGTSGTSPQAVIVYVVRVPAAGLSPATYHSWLQTVDPATCVLGDRVAVAADLAYDTVTDKLSMEEGADYEHLTLAAADADFVLITAGPDSGERSADLVLGVDLARQAQAWTVDLREEFATHEVTSVGAQLYVTTTREPSHWDFSYATSRIGRDGVLQHLVDERTSAITQIAPNTVTLNLTRDYYWLDGIYTASLTDGTLGKLTDLACATSDDGTEYLAATWIATTWAGETARNLVLYDGYTCLRSFDAAGTVREVLTPQQLQSLEVQVMGATHGQVYITTTDEAIIVDLATGDDAGRWYGWYPLQDAPVGSADLTLWYHNENGGYAITENGTVPAS